MFKQSILFLVVGIIFINVGWANEGILSKSKQEQINLLSYYGYNKSITDNGKSIIYTNAAYRILVKRANDAWNKKLGPHKSALEELEKKYANDPLKEVEISRYERKHNITSGAEREFKDDLFSDKYKCSSGNSNIMSTNKAGEVTHKCYPYNKLLTDLEAKKYKQQDLIAAQSAKLPEVESKLREEGYRITLGNRESNLRVLMSSDANTFINRKVDTEWALVLEPHRSALQAIEDKYSESYQSSRREMAIRKYKIDNDLTTTDKREIKAKYLDELIERASCPGKDLLLYKVEGNEIVGNCQEYAEYGAPKKKEVPEKELVAVATPVTAVPAVTVVPAVVTPVVTPTSTSIKSGPTSELVLTSTTAETKPVAARSSSRPAPGPRSKAPTENPPKEPPVGNTDSSTEVESGENSEVASNSTDSTKKGEGLPIESAENCTDEIDKRILEILKRDKSQILSDQYQVTTMKLALEVLKNEDTKNITNIERYIKKTQDELMNDPNSDILKELEETYKKYGLKEDYLKFEEARKKRIAEGGYFNKHTRLNNDDLSFYMLYDKKTKGNSSSFNNQDMAISWLANKVNQKYERGSVKSNQTLLSSQIYKQLGGTLKRDNKELKKEKLEEYIKSISERVDKQMAAIRDELAESENRCIAEFATKDCSDESVLKDTVFANFLKNFDEIQELCPFP